MEKWSNSLIDKIDIIFLIFQWHINYEKKILEIYL
jgi:hypothetical protein